MQTLKFFLISIFLLFSAACAVSPWEKGNLSRPEMMFAPDALEQRISDHIYFAKEASAGGSAVSGGGCGCN